MYLAQDSYYMRSLVNMVTNISISLRGWGVGADPICHVV
jgi:hypothetical protein